MTKNRAFSNKLSSVIKNSKNSLKKYSFPTSQLHKNNLQKSSSIFTIFRKTLRKPDNNNNNDSPLDVPFRFIARRSDQRPSQALY